MHLHYIQSNATRGDALPSDEAAGGNQSRSRNQHLPTYKCDANTHSRRNSRAGKANRVPKGTGQSSVAAGFNPVSTLLHYATNSDFAPKPNRPERPITIPSAPPTLRLQFRFRNGYFAKHLQPLRNCNASKCNCSTFKATLLATMQFQAMQPQAKTTATHHSKQVPKQVRILQRLLLKLGWDKAYRHKCNPSATPLQR